MVIYRPPQKKVISTLAQAKINVREWQWAKSSSPCGMWVIGSRLDSTVLVLTSINGTNRGTWAAGSSVWDVHC